MRSRSTKNQGSTVILQRDTLTTQVLSKLMDWIMDGTLKMGDKLNSEELARQLGVSRMPIREALNGLEKMGLAESIPYVGMRLISLTHDDILQIYLMRQALEPLLAEKACENVTEADLEELEQIHAEYQLIVKEAQPDAKKIYLQNRKFHFRIYAISRMNRMYAVIESLWDTLSFFKLLYGRDILKGAERTEKTIEEHHGYIDALKNRDAEELRRRLHDSLGDRIQGIMLNAEYYEN